MIHRSIIVFLCLLLCSSLVYGQQDRHFTQYMFAKTSVNPGAAGSTGGICLNGIVRQMWTGFQNADGTNVAPESFLLTADAPFKFVHGAFSLTILQEKLAFWKDISVNLGYTYIGSIGRGDFGAGFQIEFENRSIDFSQLNFVDEDDPIKSEEEDSDMLFDFALGFYYEVPDTYYIGVSTFDILESSGKNLREESDFSFNTDRSIYLLGGYNYVLPSNPSYEIKPSAMVHLTPGAMQLDVSGIVEYQNKFWGGINFRPQESIGLIAGVMFKKFMIGYSYDVNISGLKIGGSHEIRLGYCFKLEFDRAIKIYRNTRFL
ncbi:MAG: PorP/SprF family type IX secretion system membrane protein [Bacteroidales bacterium]|nr:PorP/SprF family type IX secretion system membrane protein [Bacteroidales bacterium]MCF8386298.1 PorP/SprF family type IX secretion system membrane protein [Bacteroidales bacterium]MCF8398175.1 PorP/SprF family type IX secretion system membrane protein [Bacteroidales bacterium]